MPDMPVKNADLHIRVIVFFNHSNLSFTHSVSFLKNVVLLVILLNFDRASRTVFFAGMSGMSGMVLFIYLFKYFIIKKK